MIDIKSENGRTLTFPNRPEFTDLLKSNGISWEKYSCSTVTVSDDLFNSLKEIKKRVIG